MRNSKKLSINAAVLAMSLSLIACGKSDPVPAEESAPTGKSGESKEHANEAVRVKLTPEQIKLANISLAKAGPVSIRETLPLYGAITPNAERVREVAARFPGVIRAVNKKVGDSIRQGETLATIESNESLQSYAISSPLTGVVTMRNANPGEQSGDKMLFTVADLSTVWVEVSLFPKDVSKVRAGQMVRVTSAEANLESQGKIVYVSPLGSSANQTLTARVLLDNVDRRWAPGLYVTAFVTLSESPVPLAVRSESIQTLDESSVVYVQGAEGYEPRPIRIGRSDGVMTEVLDGLAVGDTYAAKNSYIMKAELGKGSAEHED